MLMLTEAQIERGSGAGRSATRIRGGARRSFEDGPLLDVSGLRTPRNDVWCSCEARGGVSVA